MDKEAILQEVGQDIGELLVDVVAEMEKGDTGLGFVYIGLAAIYKKISDTTNIPSLKEIETEMACDELFDAGE